MDNQEDIVNFQTNFNGPWPFTTDGIVVGTPSASFEEEMQGKITFAGGSIGGTTGTSLGTFNHENMHQWFGDNVSEAAFTLTFWKEGFATLGEYLNTARGTPPAASPAAPPSRPAWSPSSTGRATTTRRAHLLDHGALEPDRRQPLHDRPTRTRGPARRMSRCGRP